MAPLHSTAAEEFVLLSGFCSCVTIIGALFFIISFACFKRFRTFTFRMILWITIFDLILAVGNLFHYWEYFFHPCCSSKKKYRFFFPKEISSEADGSWANCYWRLNIVKCFFSLSQQTTFGYSTWAISVNFIKAHFLVILRLSFSRFRRKNLLSVFTVFCLIVLCFKRKTRSHNSFKKHLTANENNPFQKKSGLTFVQVTTLCWFTQKGSIWKRAKTVIINIELRLNINVIKIYIILRKLSFLGLFRTVVSMGRKQIIFQL